MKALKHLWLNIFGAVILSIFLIGVIVVLEELGIAEFPLVYEFDFEEVFLAFIIIGTLILMFKDLYDTLQKNEKLREELNNKKE